MLVKFYMQKGKIYAKSMKRGNIFAENSSIEREDNKTTRFEFEYHASSRDKCWIHGKKHVYDRQV